MAKKPIDPNNDEEDDLVGSAGTAGNGRPLKKNDNKPPKPEPADTAQAGARSQLRSFVERIERLEEEKKTIADDIKDVYGEAKSAGFDTKALRKIVSERKQDADERMEFETVLDLYRAALGMIAGPADEE